MRHHRGRRKTSVWSFLISSFHEVGLSTVLHTCADWSPQGGKNLCGSIYGWWVGNINSVLTQSTQGFAPASLLCTMFLIRNAKLSLSPDWTVWWSIFVAGEDRTWSYPEDTRLGMALRVFPERFWLLRPHSWIRPEDLWLEVSSGIFLRCWNCCLLPWHRNSFLFPSCPCLCHYA